jgi:hypothetical protein
VFSLRALLLSLTFLFAATAARAQGPESTEAALRETQAVQRASESTDEAPAEELTTLPGEGVETEWVPTFHPADWLIIAISILAVVGVFWLYWRERGAWPLVARLPLVGLRLAAIATLLWMWYGWSSQTFRTDLPEVIVAIDVSESMGTRDVERAAKLASTLPDRWGAAPDPEADRLTTALTFLAESKDRPLRELAERYRLRVYLIGQTVRPVDMEAEGGVEAALAGLEPRDESSALADAVRELLETQRGRSTAAILLATDGIVTRGREWEEAGETARARNVPLFFWALGDDEANERLRIVDLVADPVVFVGDRITFEVRVQGLVGDAGARVALRKKGDTETLAEAPLESTGASGEGSATLEYEPPEAGDFDFEVEVISAAAPPAEPASDADVEGESSRVVAVQVRDETIRVLYVQGYPSWEFRHLKDAISRQRKPGAEDAKTFDLKVVLQEADLGYARVDEEALASLPATRDELFAYDVVILGDVPPGYLGRPWMENLRQFVEERGGGLIFSAGPRNLPWDYRQTPLEPLFPFDPAGVTPLPAGDLVAERKLAPTRLGLTTAEFQLAPTPGESLSRWSDLSGLRWYVPLRSLRPGARSLAELAATDTSADPIPVVAMQYFGAGKTLFVGTDETWIWRRRGGDEAFRLFWTRAIRDLARAKLLGSEAKIEVASDRREYRFGEAVNLRVRFFDERQAPADDDGVSLVLTGDDGARRTLRLSRPGAARGEFSGSVEGLPEGSYRALLVTPATGAAPPSTTFAVAPPPGELARTRTDLAGMRAAASRSGGAVYREPDFAQALEDLPTGRAVRVDASRPVPFWNHWIAACVFISVLTCEWILRRRAGML